MSTNPTPPPVLLNLPPETLRRHAKSARVAGLISVLVGIAAIALPGLFTLGIEVFVGVLLLIAGLTQIFAAFGSTGSRHWLLALVTGLLAAIAGVLFLLNPLKGVMTLTALLGIYFLVSGILRLGYSFQLAGGASKGVSILNAVITIVLGVLVLAVWPEASIYILGILLGIDLIFLGLFLLTYGSACKKMGENPPVDSDAGTD